MILGNTVVFARSLHLGRFAFAALFLFVFVSGSWAEIRYYSNYYCSGKSESECRANEGLCGPLQWQSCNGDYVKPGYLTNCRYDRGCYCDIVLETNACHAECSLDSLSCVNAGNEWIPGSGGACGTCNSCDAQCQCEEQGMLWTGTECIEDTTVCADMRQDCAGLGGEFTGSVIVTGGDKCCSGVCDLCGSKSMNRIANLKKDECCSQLQAPPAENVFCSTPIQSGCGFTTSQFQDPSSGEWKCQDPNLDQETMDRYVEQCSAEVSSSSEGPGPGSSGDGTSSEGGLSSGGETGDCQECPWLDSILDTLHSIHYTIDDIKTCMQVPGACPGFDFSVDFSEMPVFAFDTAFRKYLKPLMDSTLKVDSLQLKALLKLDTNQLKLLKADSASLKNDTVTWTKFDALGNVIDTSVHSQIDTTRKWFKRIADSIGVSTDSLVAHIDSIVRHIPDSILDSIVKYQQYANDNFDSVLFGTGKGFSLVDSLIDSSVKYFKESNQKWNEYISMYGDSTQKIHEEIIDLPGRNASAIGQALGYGDTATSNLRGDLNGIREAIEGLGDTSGLGGYGDGYGDSLGRYRDSINKYYISDERFGDLVDSMEVAWGVDSLDARWDSSYAYGLCNGDDCPPCSDDSCMGSLPANFVQRADSIARIAGDSLEASTKRQRDSLPTFWDSTFKELKQYSWFGSFDSTFLANIGAKIPNSNTCPEHCFAQDVNGTYAYVAYNMHLDWKLCRPIAPNVLNSLNAFDILKLLARILTVVTCLSILMWEVSSRRGGGIGL